MNEDVDCFYTRKGTDDMRQTFIFPAISEKFTMSSLGLKVTFDASEIVPADPGQGCPVNVETIDGRHSASYSAATCAGELGCGDYQLNPSQLRWLNSLESTVESFYDTFPEGI